MDRDVEQAPTRRRPHMEHCKVIVVFECEFASAWRNPGMFDAWEQIELHDIQENVPDYVETLCSPDVPPDSFYRLSDPTVYVRLLDFDADRREQVGAFKEAR